MTQRVRLPQLSHSSGFHFSVGYPCPLRMKFVYNVACVFPCRFNPSPWGVPGQSRHFHDASRVDASHRTAVISEVAEMQVPLACQRPSDSSHAEVKRGKSKAEEEMGWGDSHCFGERAYSLNFGYCTFASCRTLLLHFHFLFPSLCGLSMFKTLYSVLNTCHFLKSSNRCFGLNWPSSGVNSCF
jgi:hypothetical protein